MKLCFPKRQENSDDNTLHYVFAEQRIYYISLYKYIKQIYVLGVEVWEWELISY